MISVRESKEYRGYWKLFFFGVPHNLKVTILHNLCLLSSINPRNIYLNIKVIKIILFLFNIIDILCWFVETSDFLNAYDILVVDTALEHIKRQIIFIKKISYQVSSLCIRIQVMVRFKENEILRERKLTQNSLNITTGTIISVSTKNCIIILGIIKPFDIIIQSDVVDDVFIFIFIYFVDFIFVEIKF